jgi:hypothetical protein
MKKKLKKKLKYSLSEESHSFNTKIHIRMFYIHMYFTHHSRILIAVKKEGGKL